LFKIRATKFDLHNKYYHASLRATEFDLHNKYYHISLRSANENHYNPMLFDVDF